jgi:hypothetical protein
VRGQAGGSGEVGMCKQSGRNSPPRPDIFTAAHYAATTLPFTPRRLPSPVFIFRLASHAFA